MSTSPDLGPPRVCPVLVGRAAEREALATALDELGHGRGQALALAGEAGIGKSRLLTEAIGDARQRGLQKILHAQCFEHDRAIPYAPLLNLPWSADVPGELNDLVLGVTSAAHAHADPAQRRLHVYRGVLTWLAEQASSRPLLVTFEDLHWCDENTLELVGRLARLTSSAPILLLVTYRADELPPRLAEVLLELQRARALTELRLQPLSDAEVAAMLRAMFTPATHPRREQLDRIVSLSEGNPFYVEELVDSAETFTAHSRAQPHVPATIQALAARRVAQLSPAARDMLALAALSGRRFGFDLLQALTGESESALLDALKELVAAKLLVEESAEQFAFRHALIAEAISAQLLARERRGLHAHIAACLEHLQRDGREAPVEDLARHWFEAEAWPAAYEWAIQAAERARVLQAPAAAVEHLSRALLASQHLPNVAQGQLYSARGAAYETLGALDLARADHERAIEFAHARADPAAECRARLDLGFVWTALDYARAGQEFHTALDLARATGDATLLAHALNRVANWQVNTGQAQEALPKHREALLIFEELDDRAGMAETLDLLGLAAIHTGETRQGVAYYQRAAALFRELDDRRGLASTLAMLGQMGGMAPLGVTPDPGFDLATSVAYAEESVALARSSGWRGGEAFALAGLAMALQHSADFRRALLAASSCLAIAEELEHQQWIALAHLVLGGTYVGMLALPLAAHEFVSCLELAVAAGSAIFSGQARASLAWTQLMQGDVATAQSTLAPAAGEPQADDPAIPLAQRWLWVAQARLALARGDGPTALRIANRLGGETGVSASEARLLRADALASLGRLDDAEACLRAMLQAAQANALRLLGLRTLVALAHVLRRQRRSAEARAVAADAQRQAVELARTMPDTPVAELDGRSLRVNFLEGFRRLLPPDRPPTALQASKHEFAGLTARERQVAVLVAQGRSNAEIAAALVIGERTAQTHVANILHKLDCSTRAQVAAWATARGLVSNMAR